MATIGNVNEATFSDGNLNYMNVDTVNHLLQLLNGMLLALSQSATAPALATAGTISTSQGVSRVAPAAAVTGIIMAAGITPGQICLVVNESAVGNSITFNTAPGTSNVANSATEALIPGLESRLFVWDSVAALWFSLGDPLVNGTFVSVQSATAVVIATSGQIATSGVGVSRLAPAGAVTGITMQAGTFPGQMCLVVNESAVGNSITFNTTPATSNVADSLTEAPLAGLQSRLFVWDSVQALWFPVGNPLANGTYISVQSATAVAIANNGQITTSGVGVSRLAPAGAVTGITMQAGVYPGQEITVVNESVAANTITFNTTPATANVADSATEANIPGLTARSFVWDSSTSLWYRCN